MHIRLASLMAKRRDRQDYILHSSHSTEGQRSKPLIMQICAKSFANDADESYARNKNAVKMWRTSSK